MGLVHDDLCFGCGRANPSGLRLAASTDRDGVLRGRFLVGPDHRGATGAAHPGALAAGLAEAMALVAHADGLEARVETLELRVEREPTVGEWVDVEARRTDFRAAKLFITASATGTDGVPIAHATGTLVPAQEH